MPKGHLPVRSYLAVPVKSRSGEVLGGLFFGHHERGVFRKEDELTLDAVSAHAAIALDNAKLYQAARQAEAQAQAEREKLRQLFLQSPALIIILKGPDHLFEFVNASAYKLLGGVEVIGKPLSEAIPEFPAERRKLLDRVFLTGERYAEEAMSSTRDWQRNGRPHERFFNMVYEPYRGTDGRVEGLMAFGFEVTDQVLANRKIERVVQELEVANRAKDEFLAVVSHELRTPLNAILGWTRMLRSSSFSEEKRSRALETIERNANAQAQLIEDLLDVSRIISGKLRLDVASVDVASVLDEAIDVVRPAAYAKGIRLKQTLDPNAGPILGDPNRLKQVIWNLLTNAVKFTPKGGSVHIALRKRDSSIEIVVSDSGQGIEPEFLEHVFERFRQADATTTRKHGGLGLGLAIVRSLVELHGGTVRVTSEGLGKGSSFIVCLPISPLRGAEIESPPAVRLVMKSSLQPSTELANVHVLVVDDEDDARDLVAEMLISAGAEVSTAASAREALGFVRERRPDLVVSDIGMPGEDGYSFIKQLRELPASQGGRTPAIALTAYARVEDRTKALLAGFNMHVTKPVEPRELIALLSSLAALFERK
ncbi:MAG TPA: ATP-binding protein, partial [Polyangiaceae bacterium]|nr:ATP-binding protein [Polyangiaceae bacterium]